MEDPGIETIARGVHKYVTNTLTVLVSYIFANFLRLVHSIAVQEPLNTILLRSIALIIYSLLAFGTYRGLKIATWMMAFCLLFSGIGSFVVGVLAFSSNQNILKFLFIILGIYFIYGPPSPPERLWKACTVSVFLRLSRNIMLMGVR